MKGRVGQALRDEVCYLLLIEQEDPSVAASLRRGGFWSQKEIAERVGCSRQYIHLMEQSALKKIRLAAYETVKEYGSLTD
tara:strand:- start:767 stop:1006 length:240 start_codon:yes stop_codon:yes gene_type:complete